MYNSKTDLSGVPPNIPGIYRQAMPWTMRGRTYYMVSSMPLHSLLSANCHLGLNVRISTEEMALINETTTNRARVTGGGYAGAMGIWHELHCINNLRKLLHWDHYSEKYGDTASPEAFGTEHSGMVCISSQVLKADNICASDHCLDMIRQSLMCRPDTDLYPFSWGEDGIPSPHVKSLTPKKCVRWDSLDNWASQRALRPGGFSYIREHHDE